MKWCDGLILFCVMLVGLWWWCAKSYETNVQERFLKEKPLVSWDSKFVKPGKTKFQNLQN